MPGPPRHRPTGDRIPAPPLALPRQLLRRTAALLAALSLLALGTGLWRMQADIDGEVDAAQALSRLLAHLASLPQVDDAQALQGTRRLLQQAPLRHLALDLVDAQGRVRLRARPGAAVETPAPDTADAAGPPPAAPGTAWPLARPAGPAWTVRLQPSRDSERDEALADLRSFGALLALGAGATLLLLGWTLRRAFAPLQRLLDAIARIERHDTAAAAALPRMPVHELERVAQALRHLATALGAAEAERRALGQRVITLQEDERARLARDLHDEFGQHLTALRADVAWLQRRLDGDPEAAGVLQAVQAHGQRIHEHLRSVLARLRPLQGLDDAGRVPTPVLRELMQTLVDGWNGGAPSPLQVTLHCTGWLDDRAHAAPAAPAWLPAPLVLALFRITQESLTNAARHARARQVQVVLHGDHGDPGPTIGWSVRDDGIGLGSGAAGALRRGGGLAGMRERVWALGAELALTSAGDLSPGHTPAAARGGPGLRLSARLPLAAAATARG